MGIIGAGIGIPFRKSSVNWESYWATRFPSSLTLTVDSDTQITLNWTNNGDADYSISVERATDMINFAEVITVVAGISIYLNSGLTESTRYSYRVRAFKGSNYSTVYSNIVYDATLSGELDDGNTVFGFDFLDESTITKVGKLVSAVGDKWGAENNLLQAGVDSAKPIWLSSGLLFDGVAQFMKAVAFTFNRPEFMYLVVNQITWTNNDTIFDGNGNATGILQQVVGTPQLNMYAGAGIGSNKLPLQRWGIVRCKFNSTTSSIQINLETAVTGNTGTGNMGGLNLGCNGNTLAFGRFQIKALLGRKTADAAGVQTSLYNFLRAKYLPLGVWGTGVAVMVADIPAEQDNIYEPFILYEGNPQILAGTVFKMWYTGGWAAPNTYYAESLDGLTWTKYSATPVIANHSRNSIIKVGATYYCYVHEMVTNTKIDLYTSADGVNFSLHTANVLIPGSAGAWDDSAIHNTFVIIENGVWHMFYDALRAGGNFNIGLATSSNGVTWVKHGSNPVISGTSTKGAPCVRKIGNEFYMWCLGAPFNQLGLPSDLYRYKSPDLITWTQDVIGETFIRTQADEGTGSVWGQVADPHLIEINNKVYMFYAASSNGSIQAGAQRIKLSITDMPFTDLVKTNEGNL